MADSSNGSHQWKETDSRNLHFLPASRAPLQRGDKPPEMSVLPWESCGESLTDVVKAKPLHPEILDKICFCEFARSHHSCLWLCIQTHTHTHLCTELATALSHCSTQGHGLKMLTAFFLLSSSHSLVGFHCTTSWKWNYKRLGGIHVHVRIHSVLRDVMSVFFCACGSLQGHGQFTPKSDIQILLHLKNTVVWAWP